MPLRRMRLALNRKQAQLVVGPRPASSSDAQRNDSITEDAFGDGGRRQGPLLEEVPNAVVANAADVTALGGNDAVEEAELGVAAIHDVQVIGLDGAFEDSPLVGVASRGAGDVDADGYMAVDFKVGVQPPFCQATASSAFEERRLGHLRQGREQSRVHERDDLTEILQLRGSRLCGVNC